MIDCLSSHTIDVRYVFTGDADDDAHLSLLQKLSPDEQLRADQFLLPQDRIAFAVGRALVRRTLSSYVDIAAENWRFLQNSHGKPDIVRSPGVPALTFNLSHSAGIVVAAFSLDRDIGIDVETTEDKLDYLEMARSQFATSEIKLLESLSGSKQRHAFLELWTLKEAYTKALGLGLSISLSDFAFSLHPPAISFPTDGPDSSDRWFFRQDNPSPSHFLAIAARRRPEEQLDCSTRQVDLDALLSVDSLA